MCLWSPPVSVEWKSSCKIVTAWIWITSVDLAIWLFLSLHNWRGLSQYNFAKEYHLTSEICCCGKLKCDVMCTSSGSWRKRLSNQAGCRCLVWGFIQVLGYGWEKGTPINSSLPCVNHLLLQHFPPNLLLSEVLASAAFSSKSAWLSSHLMMSCVLGKIPTKKLMSFWT